MHNPDSIPHRGARRHSAVRSAALIVAATIGAAVVVVGCSNSDEDDGEPAANRSAYTAASSPSASPAESQPASEQGESTASSLPAGDGERQDEDASVPAPAQTTHTPPASPVPGDPAPLVSSGDVVIKVPVIMSDGGGMHVPYEVTNNGDEPASYAVELKVTGPGGFSEALTLKTPVLQPGEGTGKQSAGLLTPSSVEVPDEPAITITSLTREST